jgi:hypothetical protein
MLRSAKARTRLTHETGDLAMGHGKDSERRYANRQISQLKKMPVKATGHPVSDICVSFLRFPVPCLQHALCRAGGRSPVICHPLGPEPSALVRNS